MSILPRRRFLHMVIALTLLMPLISFSQVRIKEKVEIKPKAPAKVQSSNPRLQSDEQNHDYFNPPIFHSNGVLSLWTAIVESGEISIQGGFDDHQGVVITVLLFGGFQDRPIAWAGSVQGASTRYDTLPGGYIPDIQMYIYGRRDWTDGTWVSIFDDRVVYHFSDWLYNDRVLSTPVKGTATVTGTFLPNMKFDAWNVTAGDMTVSGLDSVYVSCAPLDGKGGPYEPAGTYSRTPTVTWQVRAKGEYAYLSYPTYTYPDGKHELITYYSAKEVTVPQGDDLFEKYGWFATGVYLVYDESKGSFDGATDTVFVTVSGGGRGKTIPVVLTKRVTCASVTFTQPRLAPGETTTLEFKKEDGSTFDAGTEFDVAILGGGSNPGSLSSSSGSGTSLTKTKAPVTYVAPATIEGDSLVVQVAAYAYNPVAGGGSGGGDETSALAKGSSILKKAQGQVATQTMALNSDRAALERIGKLLANSSCTAGEVVVGAKKVPKAILLDPVPSTVVAPGMVYLNVTLLDGSKHAIGYKDVTDARIDFSVGDEFEKYGQLRRTDTIEAGMTLTGVKYGSPAVLVFDKLAYDDRFPLRVNVSASGSNNKSIEPGVETITVVGAHTVGEYFNQGSIGWSTDTLDTYVLKKRNTQLDSVDANGNLVYGTIQKAGCTVSCIAMVLKAFGCDVDPGKLNRWMRDNGAFDIGGNGEVGDWTETIAGYPGSPVTVSLQAGDGLRRNKTTGALVKPPPLP